MYKVKLHYILLTGHGHGAHPEDLSLLA